MAAIERFGDVLPNEYHPIPGKLYRLSLKKDILNRKQIFFSCDEAKATILRKGDIVFYLGDRKFIFPNGIIHSYDACSSIDIYFLAYFEEIE